MDFFWLNKDEIVILNSRFRYLRMLTFEKRTHFSFMSFKILLRIIDKLVAVSV